ncbi:hypothetical protein [Natrinema amylolyticum]|uniref:hypothetical protein n=1 Tax=Natrinema amylolyticum TaxID=2878679 RepID=UPI001CFB8EE5|nr:hypothetical protein [Natrinema amylolyticum]
MREDIRIPIPRSVYQAAREEKAAIPNAVTAAQNNEFLDGIVRRIIDSSSSLPEALHAVQSFVDTIDYATDIESTETIEYVRHPSETLVDGEGDCEDKAVLLAGLLSCPPFNYKTGLVFPPKHCATLAPWKHLPTQSFSADPLIVTVNGTEFVYVESVAAVPLGNWAEDYGQGPILASYVDFWEIHDMNSLIASAEHALGDGLFPTLRAYT